MTYKKELKIIKRYLKAELQLYRACLADALEHGDREQARDHLNAIHTLTQLLYEVKADINETY